MLQPKTFWQFIYFILLLFNCSLKLQQHQAHLYTAIFATWKLWKQSYAQCGLIQCLSICHIHVLYWHKYTHSQTFLTIWQSYHSNFFIPNDIKYGNTLMEPPNGGTEWRGVWRNYNFQPISCFISEMIKDVEYLRNSTDTKLQWNTNRNLHTHPTQRWSFEWLWVTSSHLAKFLTTRSIARPLCDS